jgi:hypothetical protein
VRPEEARGLVALLMAAYPRTRMEQPSVNLYASKLEPHDVRLGRAAIDLCSARHTHLPSLAEVLAAIAEVAIGAPTPLLAWEQACLPGPHHPLVRRAMHAVGGAYTIRTTDKPSILRSQFARVYEEVLQAAHRELHSTGQWSVAAQLPAPPQQLAAGGEQLPERTEDSTAEALAHLQAMQQGVGSRV